MDVWISQMTTRTLAPSNNAFRGLEPLNTPVENWGQGGEWKKEGEEQRGKASAFPQFSTSGQVGVLRGIGDVIHRLHHSLPEVWIRLKAAFDLLNRIEHRRMISTAEETPDLLQGES